MVFIETLHFDKYIYSPTTEYHKINDYTKIHITYIALIFCYYMNTSIIILIILAIYIYLFKLNLYFTLSYLSIINKNILYIVFVFISTQFMDYSHLNNKMMYKLIFPYYWNLDITDYIYKFQYKYVLWLIPYYIIRMLVIYIVQSNLLNILFTFTKYQTVVQILTKYFSQIYKFIILEYNNYILNLFLGYIFIENILINLIDIFITIKLKDKYIISQQKINLIIIVVKYSLFLLYEKTQISLVLWNRNINYINFKNLKFY